MIDKEKLLEILRNNKDPITYTEYEKNSDIRKFLLQFNIKSGKVIYHKDFIYAWYLSWSRIKLTQWQFQKEMKKRVKHRRSWYYLDEQALTVSRNHILKRFVKHVFKKAQEEKKEERSS